MIKQLFSLLAQRPAAAPAIARLDLATAALFVHVARADHDYSAAEQAMIDRVLATEFELSEAEAAALRREAEAAEAESVGVHRFTAALKQGLEEHERGAFLEQIWRIVLADETRAPEEDAFMRKLAGLLHIPDAVSNAARRRAAESLRADRGGGA